MQLLMMNSQKNSMDQESSRLWKVLNLNVRGLNGDDRQRDVRAKIEESQCSVICLQKTKVDYFNHRFIHKFCPRTQFSEAGEATFGRFIVGPK